MKDHALGIKSPPVGGKARINSVATGLAEPGTSLRGKASFKETFRKLSRWVRASNIPGNGNTALILQVCFMTRKAISM